MVLGSNLVAVTTLNQPFRFRTRNWVEKNYDSNGTYGICHPIGFKTLMIGSNLSHYSDEDIHDKGIITVPNTGKGAAPDNRNKQLIFKNVARFTNWISEINNSQVNDAHDVDVVMRMYNLIEYRDNYSKTFGRLWQYYRDEPVPDGTNSIIDVPPDNSNGTTGNDGIKDVKRMEPLNYLCNFWRTFEMPLISCVIILMLTW